jgi:hypothetical protein
MYERISGGYSVRDPPLPIPNREVKPYCADGTAPSGWESRTLPDQYNSLVVVRLQGFFCFNSKKSFILGFSFIVFFSFSTAAQQDDIKLKIDSLNSEIELLRSEYLSNNVKTTEQLIKDLRKSRSRHQGGVALGGFMSGIGIGLFLTLTQGHPKNRN